MNFLIFMVDDEPNVELLFRPQFRYDLRAGHVSINRHYREDDR